MFVHYMKCGIQTRDGFYIYLIEEYIMLGRTRTVESLKKRDLKQIKTYINFLIDGFKRIHNGYFSGLRHSQAFELLYQLRDEVDAEIRSHCQTPPQQYVGILAKMQAVMSKLPGAEKSLANDIKEVLVAELEGFAEVKRKCDSSDEAFISLGIQTLQDLSWQVKEDEVRYPLWEYFCQELAGCLQDENLNRLIIDLNSKMGLRARSYTTSIISNGDDSLYGRNATTDKKDTPLDEIISDARLLRQSKKIEEHLGNKEYLKFSGYIENIDEQDSDINTKQALVRFLKGRNNNYQDQHFFGPVQEKISAFEEQLEKWSMENIIAFCNDILCGKTSCKQFVANGVTYSLPIQNLGAALVAINEVIGPFIRALIEDVVNPVFTVFDRYAIGDHAFKYRMEQFVDSFKNPVLQSEQASSHSEQCDEEANSVAIGYTQLQYTQAVQALRLANQLAGVKEQLVEKYIADSNLQQNPSLVQALSAAYAYSADAKSGEHGKDAAILFIENLLPLYPFRRARIQQEAKKFIRGEGSYGAWYGGASGCHRHSRVRYIFDSGLFEEMKNELVVAQPRIGLFREINNVSFSNLDAPTRMNITERFKQSPALSRR